MNTAIYARVSTDEQKEGKTIDSQIACLKEYASRGKYNIIKEYIDDGWSGSVLNRPALDQLRDDAAQGIFEVVIFNDVDRLARDMGHQAVVLKDLRSKNVKVIFTKLPTEETPVNSLLTNILGSFAQFEREMILDRTRRGKKNKAQKGLIIGNIPPYGYNYVKRDKDNRLEGYYKVNDAEAKVVKLIFDLFINKQLSIRGIAKELTRRGIPPRRGKHWRTSSLHRIIRNETFVGITYYNKHTLVEAINHRNSTKYMKTKKTSLRLKPKDQWIPILLPENLKIISKETFDLARLQLKRNSDLSPRNVKHAYLLRGLVICGNCQAPFHGSPCHGKLFYRCGNRHRRFPLPKECKAPMITADDLENAVWNKFCEAIKHPRLITEQVIKLKEKTSKVSDAILNDTKVIDRNIGNTQNEENRLLEAYRQNVITLGQLKEQMVKIQENREQLKKEKQGLLSTQENRLSSLDTQRTINDYCQQVKRRLENLKDNFEGKRYLLALALNKVVLDGKKVRIKGVIPLYPLDQPNIAFTTSVYCVLRPQQSLALF